MKALLVDDNPERAALLTRQLRRMGIEPVLAQDLAQALAGFKAQHPELVLIDVSLAAPGAYELSKRLRQIEQGGEWTPILFMTGESSDEDLARGIAVGGDDFLLRPVSDVVLGAKLRALQRMAQMRHSLVMLTRRLDEANRELTRLSSVDGLTGIANRRIFDESLLREWARGMRHASPISLLMCDVDCFKQYNDTYGHQAGDECLRAVARSLAARVRRPTDLVARYGGEEFAVLLPDTDAEGARQLADLMCAGVSALGLEHASAPTGRVTLSVGVASRVAERSAAGQMMLVKAADAALYEAKRGGRNRVALDRQTNEVE